MGIFVQIRARALPSVDSAQPPKWFCEYMLHWITDWISAPLYPGVRYPSSEHNLQAVALTGRLVDRTSVTSFLILNTYHHQSAIPIKMQI